MQESCEVTRGDDGVWEIALNRPDRRNALDYAAAEELVAHLEAAAADEDARAVLIHGHGRSFCAGGDLEEFARSLDNSASVYHDTGDAWVKLMRTIPGLRLPVVVAAHGHALAGGCGIVAAADVALVAEGTQLGLTEIRIGLFPAIVYSTVAAAVGPRRARELALTARRVDAEEAVSMGLAHRLLPAEGFLDAAREVAAQLAAFAPAPMRLGKELMRQADRMSADDGALLGKAMRGAFMTTEDFRNGVEGFLTKR